MDTSEKNAAGPPGCSRREMKPSMSLWKPRDTWVVDMANIAIAMVTNNLLIFGVRRFMVRTNKHAQNSTKFIPAERGRVCPVISCNSATELRSTHRRTWSRAIWPKGRPCRAGWPWLEKWGSWATGELGESRTCRGYLKERKRCPVEKPWTFAARRHLTWCTQLRLHDDNDWSTQNV